ncbi:MAG TPA: serine protease [Sporichthyaceae bacterium]|jgi:S1-C subfamily serine protease
MSTTWVIGSALSAAALATVLIGSVLDVDSAQAAAPAAAVPAARATALPTLSVAATKKLATAAANIVSPALADIRTDTAAAPAAGTGIVLTATGEVLTNYHVVTGATRILATDVGTGRTYPATVLGYNAAEDIAVLQLTGATGLPVAHLASTPATVGQSVFAVGNAGGVGGAPAWASGSVTDANRSIVATNERNKVSTPLTGMLQTTAPIVPGYSGGALVNTAGQVVGMDTAGSFPTPDKPATAAYAIPIARAVGIANAITAP